MDSGKAFIGVIFIEFNGFICICPVSVDTAIGFVIIFIIKPFADYDSGNFFPDCYTS